MSSSVKKGQREALLYLWNEGVRNAKELHTRTNISLSTIYENIKKLEETGTTEHRGGNGRPRKITQSASRAIGQYIRHDPFISTRTITMKLEKKGIKVSHVTVFNHLASSGYLNSLPYQTPMLTTAHKEARVQWAQKHLHDRWNRTFFSDETAFQLFRNTIRVWYKGARPLRRIPKDRTKIMAWGGFWAGGKSSLFCFKEVMNAEFYVRILDNHIPEVKEMLGKRWRWQQDNDPKHTSHLAMGFLRERVPEVMDWPSNSPDLNPIENMWGIIKRNVEKRMPKNIGELEQYMIEEWNEIPMSTLKNLTMSMKRRCELVLEANGDRISY